jgi:hypothetical protein
MNKLIKTQLIKWFLRLKAEAALVAVIVAFFIAFFWPAIFSGMIFVCLLPSLPVLPISQRRVP